MNREVFISYSRRNYDAVMEIKRRIDADTGQECWMDLNQIESGSKRFSSDIINGINDCKVFLFMLSAESQQSEWALKELAFADKKKKHVVLVNIDGCEMNDEFSFNYILTDTILWTDKHQREKLLRDLCGWLGGSQHKPASKPGTITIKDPLQELEERLARLDRDVGELVVTWEKNTNKYGFEDKTGRVVIPCQWDGAWGFREGLARVYGSNERWGYIDKTGRVVIPCQWEGADDFSEGFAMVISNDKRGYIDKLGRVISPCQWCGAYPFREGCARVRNFNGKWGYIDKTGLVVSPCQWNDAEDFSEGLAMVKDPNGKYGYIDKTGRVVIPCIWEFAQKFSKGLTWVYDSHKSYKIDKTGKVVC